MDFKDEILFEHIRKRDRSAFDTFFRRWYPCLVSFACRFVSKDIAENKAQDLMFKIWMNAENLNIKGELGNYLYNAIKYACFNEMTHQKIHRKYDSEIREFISEVSIDTDYVAISEFNSRLKSLLRQLPSEQKDAFEMNRFKNMSYKEIAEETGVTQKAVEYRISKALKFLRESLKDYL